MLIRHLALSCGIGYKSGVQGKGESQRYKFEKNKSIDEYSSIDNLIKTENFFKGVKKVIDCEADV